MPKEVEIEISKLLHSSFIGGAAVSMRDLSRMWSLEMQWFSPDSSLSLAKRLHSAGWLVGSADSLEPFSPSMGQPPELGWHPSLSSFEDIPEPPEMDAVGPAPSPLRNLPENQEGGEPSGIESRLARLASTVSSMSGLDRREVMRRAERKRRALGPVSLEIAMLLLAREQNLEMEGLVGLLD